jgi:hypothetical protein
MLKGGEHPKVVQEMMGHANINITLDTYSHVLPDMQDRAAPTKQKWRDPESNRGHHDFQSPKSRSSGTVSSLWSAIPSLW